MVFLSSIVTKSGDGGDTGLGDGTRVPKDHARVAAYGSVDELNSVLGLLLASCIDLDAAIASEVRRIQNDLFDVGADLCMPPDDAESPGSRLRVTAEQSKFLEDAIDRYGRRSKSRCKASILPGGTPASAWCHLARTVCRRAERDVVTLMRSEKVGPEVVIYLNRLSDYLFVLARRLNGHGELDVLWVPGGKRPPLG
ncbi:MAG: cob(I)yrinic acid a,c-diamide adenosyltransferase [Gemmataceae bacterium]